MYCAGRRGDPAQSRGCLGRHVLCHSAGDALASSHQPSWDRPQPGAGARWSAAAVYIYLWFCPDCAGGHGIVVSSSLPDAGPVSAAARPHDAVPNHSSRLAADGANHVFAWESCPELNRKTPHCCLFADLASAWKSQSPTSSVYSPRPDAAQQPDSDPTDPMSEMRMLPSPFQTRTELVPPPPRRVHRARGASPPLPRGRELQSHRLAIDFPT